LKKGPAVDNFLGFGVAGDLFITTKGARINGVAPEDKEIMRDWIIKTNPHNVRLLFDYKWWENAMGYTNNLTYEPLDNFINAVRLYHELGIEINITPWANDFAYAMWQLSPDGNRAPPDEAIIPTSKSLARLLRYLIIDLGLDNVKYIILANEPDQDVLYNTYRYKKQIKALDWALREEGIRDLVGIIGSDDSAPPNASYNTWFERVTAPDVIKYYDYTASHTYHHWFGDLYFLKNWIRSRMELSAKQAGRDIPFMITEFGHGYDPGENENGDYGTFLAAFALTSVNEGVVYLSHWHIMDTWFTEWTFSRWGLIRFKTEGWSARPPWYAWSLLCNHTAIGDKITAFESQFENDVVASMFEDSAGKISIAAVNPSAEERVVTFIMDGIADRQLSLYVYDAKAAPDDNLLIEASGTVFLSGSNLTLTIGAGSFVVLSER